MTAARKIFLILAILWMTVIFCFSARPGTVSEKDSGRVGMLIGQIFVPGFEEWSEARQQEFAEAVDHPVRKTAHASEYAFLGFLAAGVYVCDGKKAAERKRFPSYVLVPWLAASAYAATDEFHQLFVPGRSGQVSDVLLDSAGAMAGVLIFLALRGLLRRKIKEEKYTAYDRTNQRPVLRCSICTGEQVAGFQDITTGKFEEVMLIRCGEDLQRFREKYGIEGEIEKIY